MLAVDFSVTEQQEQQQEEESRILGVRMKNVDSDRKGNGISV